MLPAPSAYPETYSKLLVRSFKLFRVSLLRVYFLSLLLSGIIFSPSLIAAAFNQGIFFGGSGFNKHHLLLVFIDVGTLWFLSAILWRVNCTAKNKHEPYLADFKVARKKIFYVLGAALILSLLIFLIHNIFYQLCEILLHYKLLFQADAWSAFFAFAVLFLQIATSGYVAVIFYFYFALIILENYGVITSLKQSASLAWGEVWRTFCLLVTPWLVYLLLLSAIENFFHLGLRIYFVPLDPPFSFYATLLQIFIFALFIPWGVSMMLVQLRDLELRKAAAKTNK